MTGATAPGWYPHPQTGRPAWWDGTAFTVPPAGQPTPPPPPAAWYPADRAGFERWWDGARWTDQVRPVPPPTTGLTRLAPRERIRWAGVAWGGGGGSALSTVFGVLFVLLALPPVLFALGAQDAWRAVFMAVFALGFFLMAAVMFINAHFCRVLETRSRTEPYATPGAPPSNGPR
jgi:hypothetical protein